MRCFSCPVNLPYRFRETKKWCTRRSKEKYYKWEKNRDIYFIQHISIKSKLKGRETFLCQKFVVKPIIQRNSPMLLANKISSVFFRARLYTRIYIKHEKFYFVFRIFFLYCLFFDILSLKCIFTLKVLFFINKLTHLIFFYPKAFIVVRIYLYFIYTAFNGW